EARLLQRAVRRDPGRDVRRGGAGAVGRVDQGLLPYRSRGPAPGGGPPDGGTPPREAHAPPHAHPERPGKAPRHRRHRPPPVRPRERGRRSHGALLGARVDERRAKLVRAKIWGCRGSLAAPGPETVRYGGNTSCVEVRPADDRLIIVDAGTGARNFGVAMGKDRPDRIDLLLTHLHLDHIEGLGFFGPIWDPGVELHIWGPPSPLHTLRERLATYFSPPLFPVHLDDIPSHLV